MTTKKLYKILDKVLPKGLCYNLRKIRNTLAWRVKIWKSKQLDKSGILATYLQDELYPEHYEITDTVSDFVRICQNAQTKL